MPARSGTTPLHIGSMRRHLTIVSDAIVSTADGFSSTPVTVLATWGSVRIRHTGQMMAQAGGQIMAQLQYEITIRFPPSVTLSPGMRVLDGARSYRIHQLADIDERHHTLELYCVEEPAK